MVIITNKYIHNNTINKKIQNVARVTTSVDIQCLL